MKNISNLDNNSETCTICSTCGKTSWYVMECNCGHIFCKYCSAEKSDNDSDNIVLTCPKCGKSVIYI